MPAPEPEDLRALGEKIDEARGADSRPPPQGALGVAFRFGTELMVGLGVGAGIGWLLDRWLHTTFLIVVMTILGAAAGILNVMRAAKELNAEAAKYPAPAVKNDDDEE